jgi:SLT domain-containing protein
MPSAEEELNILAYIHNSVNATKAAIKAEVEARYAMELIAEDLRRAESLAGQKASDAGASYTKIGRAMGTSDWRTIKDRLAYAGEEEQ